MERESHWIIDRNEPIKYTFARNVYIPTLYTRKIDKKKRLVTFNPDVLLLRSATVGAVEIFKRAVNPLLSAVLRKTEIVEILGLTGTQGAFVILVKV